jgi:uncharacterized membrane protein YgdD (TMEM256/DUF423 family)
MNTWTVIGAAAAFLAVAAGAFGAHALRSRLSSDLLQVFEVGVRYHMYHALALVLVGVLDGRLPAGPLRLSGFFFTAGIVIFSGSLYALALSGVRWLGAITPLGGAAFLSGWIALLLAAAGRR